MNNRASSSPATRTNLATFIPSLPTYGYCLPLYHIHPYGFAIRNADGTLYDSVWVNASSAELELTSEYVGKSIVFLLDFLDDLGNQETSTFYDIGEVVEDPEENNAVNVPAMGGIGLLALGLSILGLGAVSLRKK
ncbi:hypothetical protein N9137_01590 [Pseudomonadales bacterium]|nr:hypothetical protein [Pseudomonadales bacterium]